MEKTEVLVVGGGLVGSSAAVFLAHHGVPTVLAERHLGSSPHPRAIGYTPRTLELFRSVGLGDRIPVARIRPGSRPRRVRVESLAGRWFEELPWPSGAQEPVAVDDSPCLNAANITQDRLEPLLRERATELGADVRMGTRLLAFTQTEDGVTARLQDPSGHEYTLQAAYLVAADGHRSPVREALGIRRHGHGHLRTSRSVLFRAPLEPYLERGFVQFAIDQPDLQAGLITYGDGRWVLFLRDETDEDDEAALRAMIFKAIGRSDLELEVITTGRFEVSALVAERFSSGRVLLAGDAAHALPPNRAGYGANTGIEDAHNLAWKLAAVAGSASADLLETYDAERRPIAWLRYGQLFAREDFAAYADEADKAVALIDDRAMEFGQLYRSGAVLGASAELSPARPPEAWAGQPGTRAPHLWLWQAGERRSTLDLFGRDWVLLYEDDRWTNGAQQAGRALGLTLRAVRLGVDAQAETPRAFRTAFGVSEGGASLVRPDGYVAWRAPGLPTDPARSLTDALRRVSFATGLKSCDKPRVDAT